MAEEKRNLDSDVIISHLKLSRALRRCPPPSGPHSFPPAVGRLLECAAANPGVSSRELCEALDLRPSSLSEILARAENDGFLSRTVDENDRRVQRVSLTAKGWVVVAGIEKSRSEDAKKKTSCLSEEEKALFCSLCSRLSEHIEKLALELPEGMMPPPGPEGPGCPHHRPGENWPDAHRPGEGRPVENRPGEGRPAENRPGRPPLPPGGRYRC